MTPKSSRLRQLNILALTVLVLFAPFVLYYLFYFSSQKTYFVNRNFRLLTDLGSEIQKKVDSVSAAYGTAADSAAHYSATHLAEAGPQSRNLNDFFKPLIDSQRTDGTIITITTKGKPEPVSPQSDAQQDKAFSTVTVTVKREEGASWLYFSYLGKAEGDAGPVTIQARSRLDEFVSSFFQRFRHAKDFDSVFVAEDNGRVLYQWGGEELGLTNLAGLIGKDQSKVDFDRLKQNGNVADVVLTDTDYKLFLQPVETSARTDLKSDRGATWIVGGLVSASHLRSESTAISYTILIILIFLFILVVLSAPFLKLLFMGAKDTLRVADIYFLSFSALMGSALTTVFLLYSFSYIDLERTMDDQLKLLSDRILWNAETEIEQASRQLDSLNSNPEVVKKLSELATNPVDQSHRPEAPPRSGNGAGRLDWKPVDGCPPAQVSSSASRAAREPCFGLTTILKNIAAGGEYPYLISAIWMDPNGEQRIKASTRSDLVPSIQVKDRAYFQNILLGRTWTLKDRKSPKEWRFFLEPVYSKATGGQQVILSMPAGAEFPGWVSALDIRPLSVLRTVLPTELGYGYCIIDNEGRVLFHSDESRNQLENFFLESDNDSYLRSVVLAQESGLMNVQYLGGGHRLFVRPIPNTPWSLITFRDKQIIRSVGLELIAYAIYFFCFYAAILLVIFSFYYLWNRENRSALLWPYSRRSANYYVSVSVNLVLALVFGLAILILSKWALLVLAILLPSFGFFFHHYNLGKNAPNGSLGNRLKTLVEDHTPLSYKHGYVLTLVTLLLLVSVLPMLAFFKFAYDRQMKLFVGLGQISLVRGLEDRAERVQAQYFTDRSAINDMDAFVEKRLSLKNCDSEDEKSRELCDVYAQFFFNSKFVGPVEARSVQDSFESFITWFVPFTNSLSLRIHGLNQSMSGGAPLRLLHAESDSRLLIYTDQNVTGQAQPATLQIASDPPVLGRSRHFLWWFGVFLTLAFVPSALFALVFFVGRRVFLLNTDEPVGFYCEHAELGDLSQNVLVVASSFTGKDQLLRRLALEVIDLREISRKRRAVESTNHEPERRTANGMIALNYFEYKREDLKTNLEKMKLVESLLNRNQRVLVASAVDLAEFCFDSATAPDEENGDKSFSATERACALFNSFRRIYLEDRGNREEFVAQLADYERQWEEQCKPSGRARRAMHRRLRALRWECQSRVYLQAIGRSLLAQPDFPEFTPERIVQCVQDETNAYYRALWETCSKDEKLSLCHLATHQVVSSLNPSLRRLLRSGLVAREPYLRPINLSFSRFVAAQASPEKVLDWKGVQEKSVWEMLRIPFLVFLLGAAGFLFVSQRDLYNSTLAFVSAFAASMPAIFKFLGLFPSGKVGGA